MSDAKPIETDAVDPDIRRFVTALNEGYGRFPNFDTLPMDERRRAAEQVRAPWRAGGPKMWRSLDTQVAGLRARIHIPVPTPPQTRAHGQAQGQTLGAMLYLHGGGWVMFSIDTHDRLMREYAARAGVIVVGIDYSLSPEAKFPVALNEVVAAFEWMRREGGAHGIDPERLAIGGDSAGANLALAAALALRDRGGVAARDSGHVGSRNQGPADGREPSGIESPDRGAGALRDPTRADRDVPGPRALLFNYGAFTPDSSASYALYDGPRYMLTVDEMAYFWNNYTRQPADLDNPLVAPYLADLRGLPPALFTIAACDILAGGNRAMAARMAAAGVLTEVHVYEGATHSFLEAVSISPLADRALDTASRWLRGKLIAE